jgi:hypothetical protein
MSGLPPPCHPIRPARNTKSLSLSTVHGQKSLLLLKFCPCTVDKLSDLVFLAGRIGWHGGGSQYLCRLRGNCTRTKESVATKVSNLYAFRTCSPLCGPFGYLETVAGRIGWHGGGSQYLCRLRGESQKVIETLWGN